MSQTKDDSDPFDDMLPLFGLQNAVFFPQTLLALHVEHSHELAMVDEVWEGEQLVAVALLGPEWKRLSSSAPSDRVQSCRSPNQTSLSKGVVADGLTLSAPVGCMGRIIKHRPVEDGHSDILLMGLNRVHVGEVMPTEMPYDSVRVELLQDRHTHTGADMLLALRTQLCALSQKLCAMEQGDCPRVRRVLESSLSLGRMIDVLAALLPFDLSDKQHILFELHVPTRAELFFRFVEEYHARNSRKRRVHAPFQWVSPHPLSLN